MNQPPSQHHGNEIWPKPIRTYLTRDQKRVWFWIASKSGFSPFKLALKGGNLLARKLLEERTASGHSTPQYILEMAKAMPDDWQEQVIEPKEQSQPT